MLNLLAWWKSEWRRFLIGLGCAVVPPVLAMLCNGNPDLFVSLLFLLWPAAVVAAGCFLAGKGRLATAPILLVCALVLLLFGVATLMRGGFSVFVSPFYIGLACFPGLLFLAVELLFRAMGRVGRLSSRVVYLCVFLLCVPATVPGSLISGTFLLWYALVCGVLVFLVTARDRRRGLPMALWAVLCAVMVLLLNWGNLQLAIHTAETDQILRLVDAVLPSAATLLAGLLCCVLGRRVKDANRAV